MSRHSNTGDAKPRKADDTGEAIDPITKKPSRRSPPTVEAIAAGEQDEGISLEELSRTYAKVLENKAALENTLAGTDGLPSAGYAALTADADEPVAELPATDEPSPVVNPLAIVEAILFVGRAEGSAISAKDIAGLVRGVSEADVEAMVQELNAAYRQSQSALQVVELHDGFRMALSDDLMPVRDRFYGRSRPIALNQSAIDCLALIAYQPGISRERLEHQRGRPSGVILNQLVRRRLVEIRREDPPEKTGKEKPITRYFPTERLVELAGLSSLEDLPQVEELEID